MQTWHELYLLRIYTYLKFEVSFWISKNVASSFFGYSKLNIYSSRYHRCSIKKGVLRKFAKFTGKHLCRSLFFKKVAGLACHFIKKVTPAQVFSCEYCEICKNTFFTEHLWTAVSLHKNIYKKAHNERCETLWTYPLLLQRQYFRPRLNMVYLHRVSTRVSNRVIYLGFFTFSSWMVGKSK